MQGLQLPRRCNRQIQSRIYWNRLFKPIGIVVVFWLCTGCQTLAPRSINELASPTRRDFSAPVMRVIESSEKMDTGNVTAKWSPMDQVGKPRQVAEPIPLAPASEYPHCPPQHEGFTFSHRARVDIEPWSEANLWKEWSKNEYLCDGGDRQEQVAVAPDWHVWGLHQEDTVAHFDTVHGETVVQPSNRVRIYAPRFGAVRKVFGLVEHNHTRHVAGYDRPLSAQTGERLDVVTTLYQPLQPLAKVSRNPANVLREQVPARDLIHKQPPSGLVGGFLPYENFDLIRRGIYERSEEMAIAERIAAAYTWSADTAVQVTIKEITAKIDTATYGPGMTYSFDRLSGQPKLRVIKIASAGEAQPGDEIDFTIRFDNVGDEVIGNVTLIDNLTTRLEYVTDTAQSNLEADFSTRQNEGESLVLRWEIREPLNPGEGGIIRFRCRVR